MYKYKGIFINWGAINNYLIEHSTWPVLISEKKISGQITSSPDSGVILAFK